MTGTEPLISEEVKVGVYRILQETFNNVVKHAHAESITVHFDNHADKSTLAITDDGCGFDLTHPRPR